MSTIFGLIILGFLAGTLGSMVGIGGGIVIVPCLVLVFGFSQHNAQGTALAMMSMPVSLAAVWSYHQKQMVDWKVALVLALGFIVGGFLGGKFAVGVEPLTIKKVFAILMIIIAFKFLFIDKK